MKTARKQLDDEVKKSRKTEREFLEILQKAMPKQWQDFFNAYKTAKPFVLHSLYRLTQMKAELLARGDEKAWERLVEREMEMLKNA